MLKVYNLFQFKQKFIKAVKVIRSSFNISDVDDVNADFMFQVILIFSKNRIVLIKKLCS